MTTLRSPRTYHEADYEPMVVIAQLEADIIIPRTTPALDSLLCRAIADEHQLPPWEMQEEPVSIEVPLARSPCGRYHQASFGIATMDRAELQHIHRKWPIEVSQVLSHDKTKSIDIATGRNKGYRLPVERVRLTYDRMWWFAVGHIPEVRNLLSWITHLGKKRGMGAGKVEAWHVGPVEAWGTTFPIMTGEGKPLRNLPTDTRLLADERREGFGVLTYPYHDQSREEWLALPELYLGAVP